MSVERTDFVSVPATDLARSAAWYGETLGPEQTGEGSWPELRLGENAFSYRVNLDRSGASGG